MLWIDFCIILITLVYAPKNVLATNNNPNIDQIASDPIIITSDFDLEAISNNGDGTQNNPYVISNLEIETFNIQTGIFIAGTTKFFEIKNNYIQTGDQEGIYGIHIVNIAQGTAKITNNILSSNNIGIKLESAPYAFVYKNSISFNKKFGIEVMDGSYGSTIQDNHVEFTLEEGIRVEGSDSLIIGNNVTTDFNENFFSAGIGVHRDNVIVRNSYISGYWEGITISPASNIIIDNNTIYGCASGIAGWQSNSKIIQNRITNGKYDGHGIRLEGEFDTWPSNNNNISFNYISGFPSYGFHAREDSTNNIIWNNAFLDNNLFGEGGSQAFDSGISNSFERNYWDEWLEPDENGDNIVDNPYSIDGSANNLDHEPLVDLDLIREYPFSDNSDQTNEDNNILVLDLGNSINGSLIFIGITMMFVVPIIKFGKIISDNNLIKLTTKILTDVVGFAPPLLVGIISNEKALEENPELIPPELQSHKFLLNPIRLAIMKLLFTYSSHPAYLVREMLDVSWGKFSSHLTSLIEKGYISAREEFYEGAPTRILRIENIGLIKYLELRDILTRMFEII